MRLRPARHLVSHPQQDSSQEASNNGTTTDNATPSTDRAVTASATASTSSPDDKTFILKQALPDADGTCAHLSANKISDKQNWKTFQYCDSNRAFSQFTLKSSDKTLWTQGKQIVYFNDELIVREEGQVVNQFNDPLIPSTQSPRAQFTLRPCFTDKLPANTTCLATEGSEWRLWPWQPVFVAKVEQEK